MQIWWRNGGNRCLTRNPLKSKRTGTLLAFYLDQFRAVTSALYQFLVLLMVVVYQRWYLDQGAPSFVDEQVGN